MKKTLIFALVLALAVGVLATGAVFAQGDTPPEKPLDNWRTTRVDRSGDLHDYMLEAFAAELNLPVSELTARLDAGERMIDIAGAEDFPALMIKVRTAAFDAALVDGAITQAQFERMSARGAGRGNYGDGICDESGACDLSGKHDRGQRGNRSGRGTPPAP